MSSNSTPTTKSKSRSSTNPNSKATSKGGAASSSSSTSKLRSPRQQDAQARCESIDPYGSDSSDSEAGNGRGYGRYGQDSPWEIQQRREAAIILDSPELLMMHAQARNDSIPGTRYYFTKQLCGYLSKDGEKENEKVKEKTREGEQRRSKVYKGAKENPRLSSSGD